MTIGTATGRKVSWSESNGTVRIYGTSIMATGAKTLSQAIEINRRNFANFKPIA